MNAIIAAAAVALVMGAIFGTLLTVNSVIREEAADKALSVAERRRKRLRLFVLGFFGWPFVVVILLFFVVFFWDLMLAEREEPPTA